MEKDFYSPADLLNYLNEFFYNNMIYVILFILGLLAILCGLLINVFRFDPSMRQRNIKIKFSNKKWLGVVDRMTSVFPLNLIKNNINNNLSMNLPDDYKLKLASNLIVLILGGFSLLSVFLLRGIGQLWYVKILIASMCLILPYYIMALLFDLYKYHINKQIPQLIDEFRSAFIKHKKVKPALKECSLYIDKNLGRIVSRTADSSFINDSLNNLRGKFSNVWFNVFVVLLVNFKENGGELIDQLYKLNKTMTRYSNVEKKKNKRLIWYEMFAVSSSVFSIPAVLWLNNAILGGEAGMVIDTQSNIIISKVIAFSILSLIVTRVLRKI